MVGLNFPEHFHAGDAWHLQVEHRQVGLKLFKQSGADQAVADGTDVVAVQDFHAAFRHDVLVVNQQQFRALTHGSGSSPGQGWLHGWLCGQPRQAHR